MIAKTILLITLTAAMLAPIAANPHEASSFQDGRSAERPSRRSWEDLNLTAEQEAKFREINARYAPARRENARRIEDLRDKINQELMKERPSRSLLMQYAGHMGEVQKRMSLASVDHLLSVKAVLTPEQFEKFTARVNSGPGN